MKRTTFWGKDENDERTVKGENNSSYEEFHNDHVYAWEEDLKNEGHQLNADTMIVVEHFRLVK